MNRYDLINYLTDKEHIKDQIEEFEQDKLTVNKLTASYGFNVSGSSEIQDRIAENLVRILDNIKIMQEEFLKAQLKQFEIEKSLEKMDNPTYRNLLYKKYILGKNIEQIAIELKKDYKYTCTIHGYALNDFDKLCENFEK